MPNKIVEVKYKVLGVGQCPRCGLNHPCLPLNKLLGWSKQFSHYVSCPKYGQAIFVNLASKKNIEIY